jgi:flavodoxin
MKTLVVYDSVFGNTEKIARAMSGALEDADVLPVTQVRAEQLKGLDVLIVGSPTRGWRASEATAAFLKNLPAQALAGVRVAAFDTRLSLSDTKSAFTRFIVRTGGYAAKPIAEQLTQQGGSLVLPPEGFLVLGEKGPLKTGELDRAAAWARQTQQP